MAKPNVTANFQRLVEAEWVRLIQEALIEAGFICAKCKAHKDDEKTEKDNEV